MTIRMGCPSCGSALKVEDRYAGRTLPCPRCQQPVRIESENSTELLDPFAEDAEVSLSSRSVPKPPSTPIASQEETPATRDKSKPKGRAPREPTVPSSVSPTNSDVASTDTLSASAAPIPVDDLLPEAEMEAETVEASSDFPDLTEEELTGVAISPRKKKRKRSDAADDEPGGSRSTSARRKRSPESEPDWRNYLHWVLLVLLLPILVYGGAEPRIELEDRVQWTLQRHPEINAERVAELDSLRELALLLTDHRIEGAFLSANSVVHWSLGLASAMALLGLLLVMWPRPMLQTGYLVRAVSTSAILGGLLLLSLQWIAGTSSATSSSNGPPIIGYSYWCALRPMGNGWIDFLGYTSAVGIGLELIKSLPVLLLVLRDPDCDFRTAGLIGLASGIGLGCVEAIFFSGVSYNGVQLGGTYLVRFASMVSLHALWTGAFALHVHRESEDREHSWQTRVGMMARALVVVLLLHGVTETLLKRETAIWTIAMALASFLWFQWQLTQARRA